MSTFIEQVSVRLGRAAFPPVNVRTFSLGENAAAAIH